MQLSANIKKFTDIFNVSRETLKYLRTYEKLLVEENKKQSLISKNSIEDIWVRHFADSAKIFYVLKDIDLLERRTSNSLCDVGSGAGFPGMIIDILNKDEEFNLETTLVESSAKKCRFLKKVKKELGLPVRIVNSRSSDLNDKFDIIAARAVAPLIKLFELTIKNGKKDAFYIFPKGMKWEYELNLLKKKWNYKINIVKNNMLIDKSGGVTLVFSNCIKK